MSKTENNSESKLNSRKFLVWIVWLLLTLGVGVYTFLSKETALLEKTLDSFFAVSMMYLGMNVVQKAGFAVADAIHKTYSNKEKEDE